jgi:hypothetical protein
VTGLARQGAEVSPATLAGTCAQAGALLAPLAEAITVRSRDSWHLHADETTWRVFVPREDSEGGQPGGSVRWWLWVFIGADTVCFVMDPTRSGVVLARHAGIEEKPGSVRDGRGRGGWSSPATSTPSTRLCGKKETAWYLLLGARAAALRPRRGRTRPAHALD